MSIVRVGSTQKFSDNWDNVFSSRKGKPAKKKEAAKKPSTAKAKKKSPGKKKRAK